VKPVRQLIIHHTSLTQPEQLTMVNESHRRLGYPISELGYYVAYHFVIGTTGKIVQTRGVDERTLHTSNTTVANESISIVLAGNFEINKPTEAQLESLRSLYRTLYKRFDIEHTAGHLHTKPTSCPGKYLLEAIDDMLNPEKITQFQVSRYYTPVPNQLEYYRDTYEEDFKVNCLNDCFVTASGYRLSDKDIAKVAACPPEYKFGTKIDLDGYGVITCIDRGSAIVKNRLDLWLGYGEAALLKLKTTPAGLLNGKVIYTP